MKYRKIKLNEELSARLGLVSPHLKEPSGALGCPSKILLLLPMSTPSPGGDLQLSARLSAQEDSGRPQTVLR